MATRWNKGGAELGRGLLRGRWESRLLRRRREAGSGGPWRAGDYVLLDIAEDGIVGSGLPLARRQLALVKTFRYVWPDRAQPGGGRLKRWCDYVVLRRCRRRGRDVGWRLVRGT